jgi:hypothetical protein
MHSFVFAGFDESRGAVEGVAVGQRYGGHVELHCSSHELLGRERALLQGETRPDVQVNE